MPREWDAAHDEANEGEQGEHIVGGWSDHGGRKDRKARQETGNP